MKIDKALLLPFLLLLSAVFITSCVSPVKKQETCEATDHSKKLRILLHKLDTVVFEPTYSELERDAYKIRYAGEISKIVEDMVNRQQDKKVKACGLSLSSQQEQLFDQLSAQLQVQVQQLIGQINEQQTEFIKPQINRINQTCTSCHQQLGIITP